MNLKVLNRFIKEHDLNFLGFEPYGSMLRTYKNRFQNDPSATNLNQWHIYEEENPDTFISMYQFWTQKKILVFYHPNQLQIQEANSPWHSHYVMQVRLARG